MIAELWKKMWAIRKPTSSANGRPKVLQQVEILRADYHGLRRLAEQIQAHADRAPYDHVAKRLRQIAGEKRKSADLFKEKILALGGRADDPQLDVKVGKNHWERMVLDLEDQKALDNTLLDQAVRLADDAPEMSDFLRSIVAGQASHKQSLLDLVARADPQANQT